MTARQEKVREALEFAGRMLTSDSDTFAAALAEVEEWEAQRRDDESIIQQQIAAYAELRSRAEAAERERDEAMRAAGLIHQATAGTITDHHDRLLQAENHYRARAEAAEAEADRLKAALAELKHEATRACQFLPMTYSLASERDFKDDNVSRAGHILRVALRDARAALAPADRNTA